MKANTMASGDSPGRWSRIVLLLLVLIPVVFNAIALFPELRDPVPSLNDDAVHYLFVQRASEALANGDNPVDHWVPELDLGFPQFFYYQHIPHLAVVVMHRLLLKKMGLFTVFNLIRYLLLIGFPLTVCWSMRRLGFSVVAAAVGAAGATLLSSNTGYGYEYGSYIWRGHGMYTQLWAVHLCFLALACLDRLLERGTGYVAGIVACSLLGLSHLIYSYIIAVAALVLFAVGLNRTNARSRLARLSITATAVAFITSYLWLPWLLFRAYMGVSPYLQRWKYDSFGAGEILPWLVNGDLLDFGRLPVLTLLLALGIASAVLTRTRPARLSLALFLFMLALFFGRPTWGKVADFLPMGEVMHFLRFLGGVHLGAILLIGLGGEWLWMQLGGLHHRWRAVAVGLILLVLLFPALRERHGYYTLNTEWMERTKKALDADEDARTILSALKELPPGRTYAGLRDNWGNDLRFGDLHFYDLLTFNRIVAILPPYQGYSLNSDFIFHFDYRNPAHYNLFNVKYVVAPNSQAMPAFLRPIKTTRRYTLYGARTRGYAEFAAIAGIEPVGSQPNLFEQNKRWFLGVSPGTETFIRYEYPSIGGVPVGLETPGCPGGGTVHEDLVLPGRLDLRVECKAASTLILKVTYHPNWRVTVDGREIRPFMVSPSLIGLDVAPGLHQVQAEYRSPKYKTSLLLLSACMLIVTIFFRRMFVHLDSLLSSRH